MNILLALLQWGLLLAVRLPLIIIGLFVVALALPFSSLGRGVPFTQTAGTWCLERLPSWAYLWSNELDGARGDKRGWWHLNAPFGLPSEHWFSRWFWLAIRNPVNNLRFIRGFSCPMTGTLVKRLAGQVFVRDRVGDTGWQFVVAEGRMFNYYGFYGVWQYGNSLKAFNIRLGFKVEPRHNYVKWSDEPYHKRFKGFTLKINPIKDIE